MKRLKSFSALILGMVMTVTLILALGEIKAKAAGLPEGLDTVSCKDGTIEYLALRLESSGNSGLAIDIQPIDANVKRNEVAYFYIRANGNNLKYLWQYKRVTDNDWVDWNSKTTPSISVAYSSDRDGMKLRCKITDASGKGLYSDEALLSYYDSSSVKVGDVVFPVSKTWTKSEVQEQSSGTYSVTISNGYKNVLLCQSTEIPADEFEKSVSSDENFEKVVETLKTGIAQDNLTTVVKKESGIYYVTFYGFVSGNGMNYPCALCCKFEDERIIMVLAMSLESDAEEVISSLRNTAEGMCKAAKRDKTSVQDSLKITTQPVSVTVNEKETASFSVKASGKGLKYLWQYKNAGSSSWTDWTSKTTASISVAYASYRNGMKLRCVVSDTSGAKVISDEVSLTYKSSNPLAITTQPKNTTVDANSLAYFEVKATGNGLKYLWQYKEAGKSTWTDWTSKTTAKISVAYASYRDGMSFRCVVTDSTGKKITSNAATLTYNVSLAITKQPANATVEKNTVASFSVKASGKGLTYLWQYKNAGDSTWTDWTSKTKADITVAYAAYRNGMSVRCIVTDASGKKVTSNAATLTYK